MSLRRSFVAIFALLAAIAAVIATACGGTTTDDTIVPITGIVIRAERLTTGRGCGTAPGQVFKYAAVVFAHHDGKSIDTEDPGSFDQPLTASVYDCFTDGTFVQLPLTNNSLTYRIEIYIYDQPAFAAAEATIGSATNDIAQALDAAALPIANPAVTKLRTTKPVWTTTCGATQQQDVEVLAICDPIAFGLGGIAGVGSGDAGVTAIDLGTDSFALPDGGTATCGDDDGGGVPEAGPPVDAGDAGDAEAGAAPDAAAPTGSSTFRKLHVVASPGGATVDLTCPDHFHLEQLTPVVTYSLDVTLQRSDGSTLGKATCSALTRLGETSSATCSPVQ